MNASACEVLGPLQERAYEACIPLAVSVELTLRCNIRCTHCYNFDRGKARWVPAAELGMEDLRPLLDDLRRAGTLFLALTGGEALLHPRFWEILDEAAARSFAVQLLSNGTLLSERVCDRLAAYPNFWGASLSLYGARAATHDAITRSPGSFERTWAGAERLRARGAAVSLKFILMKGNAAETVEVLERAAGRGFPCDVDATITGRYDGTRGSLEDRVDLETLRGLYAGPLRGRIGGRRVVGSDDDFRCNCARGNAAVSATGDVYPCIAAPLPAGNLRERSFLEIWRESPVFRWIRGLKTSDFRACAPCELKEWCRRSPGPAYVLHGDYTGVDPWTCGEARILKELDGAGAGDPAEGPGA
jgi:radical SAM protein with 4Fe4S-binding SPASM domain